MNFKVGDLVAITDEHVQECKARQFRLLLNPNSIYEVKKVNRDLTIELRGVEGKFHFSHFKTALYITDEFFNDTKPVMSSPEPEAKVIKYKFNEPDYLKEVEQYVDSTYSEHYAAKGVQTAELIYSDAARGLHVTTSNSMKYNDRFGKKEGYNRKDILKSIHYNLHTLYCLDKLESEENA